MSTLRIAVISSPRSGNTWVRSVLGDILGLQQFAVHNYIELDNIPDRCIVQLHWYREPNLQRFLGGRCFKVLVLARHPLDVLVSMLNFIRHEPLTARWLEGNAEIPKSLAGQAPTSQDFLKYAMSWGPKICLGSRTSGGTILARSRFAMRSLFDSRPGHFSTWLARSILVRATKMELSTDSVCRSFKSYPTNMGGREDRVYGVS